MGSFVLGITLHDSNRKTLEQGVIETMLRNKNFWEDVIFKGAVIVKDINNNIILPSTFLSLEKNQDTEDREISNNNSFDIMEVAKARVICEKGVYRCELSFIDKPSLYALFSLYTIKLKWVFLTEPAANYLFKETIEEIIQKNFQFDFDELMPKEDIISFYSERYPKLEFKVTIERIGSKYTIINDWSPSVMPVAELACHYFILLKKALEYLNEGEKKKLLNLLKKIHEIDISDNSIFAPIRYTNIANKILKEIIEEQKTETFNLVFCSKCGKENPATNKYCTNCGVKLIQDEEEGLRKSKKEYEKEREEAAIKELKERIEKNPNDAIAHYELGKLLARSGKYDEEAERELKEAIKIDPNNTEIHLFLASLLESLVRYDEAEKEYREAIRINPNYAEAHANLGVLLTILERYDEAKEEILKARELFEKQGRIEDAKTCDKILEGLFKINRQ